MNEAGKEGDIYKCDSLDQISGGMFLNEHIKPLSISVQKKKN